MVFRYSLYRAAALTQNVRWYSSKTCVDVSMNDNSGIVTVTMKRPPVNSLNLEFLSELATLFTELEHNKTRGMILTSLYDKKVFSAGLDLTVLRKPDPEWLKVFWRRLQDVLINLYGTSYPTVAVINGHALAGGCMLAVGCEYRIMLDGFKIGINETQVGLAVPIWLGLAMRNAIGQRQTELASTTSRLFTTEEALKMGLVDETASDKSDAVDKAERFLHQFEMVNPVARALTKKYLRGADIEVMHKIREKDIETAVSLITSPTVQQSLEDQLNKLKNKKKN